MLLAALFKSTTPTVALSPSRPLRPRSSTLSTRPNAGLGSTTSALAAAARGYPRTVVQRTGWLLDHMAKEVASDIDLGTLKPLTEGADYTVLDPRAPTSDGDRDPVWHVVENTGVEHDL